MKFNQKNLVIILVEPQSPGNIGAVARLSKNMGLTDIRLVNPTHYLNDEGFRLAHGSKDALEAFQCFNTLEEAISDLNIVIGTTNRHRDKQWPLFEPKPLADHLIGPSQTHKIGLVFGREAHGLTNEELHLCHLTSTIPTASVYPAINLAQSVMIYAYEFFQASSQKTAVYTWSPAQKGEEEPLYKKMETVLPLLPIHPKKGPAEFISLFRRVLGRTQLESRDIRIFHKLFDLIRRSSKTSNTGSVEKTFSKKNADKRPLSAK